MKIVREESFDCPIEVTLSLLRGKWKCSILWHLRHGRLRFNELQRRIPRVTTKMLSQQLKELEADGLIKRKVYPEIPPKVEYFLSYYGQCFKPIIKSMYVCGMNYAKSKRMVIDTSAQDQAIAIERKKKNH